MADRTVSPADVVRPLIRVRQYREFTSQPLEPAELDAIVDAARWSGSGSNRQPWRFITIRDEATLRHIGQAGLPQTRGLQTASAAIAIVLPEPDERMRLINAFDEGRAAERILIAASMLGLGGGIGWVMPQVAPFVAESLGLPEGWFARTMIALGHPTEQARAPKSEPGKARLPRSEVVFEERWPKG